MATWKLEVVSNDRLAAGLVRPERMTVHVGEWIDFKPSPKWRGANNGHVLSLGPYAMAVQCRRIKMKRGAAGRNGAFDEIEHDLGVQSIPYEATRGLAR